MADGAAAAGCVYLVGAGPGDPGLLTVRGLELLQRADLILYDQLIPTRILDLARPEAERICVRDLPGQHPDKYPHIHATLIKAAQAGKVVVRLKGGDPLIFGRGGEEAAALRSANVPYEIVPGVTAALAAAAYLDIPLTHRHYSSAVALITGHELPNKPGHRLDWEALARFPGTLAIYMGIARLPILIAELLKHGKDPQTPSAIVERASTGAMRSVYAPLAELESARRQAGLEAPGLILIGTVVAHRPEHSWFERLPLFGQRILVTRPRPQAEPMLRQLESLGAVPYLLPTLEIRELSDFTAVDQAIDELESGRWNWLVWTSANGVHSLIGRILARGKDLRILGGVRIAAVGPKTAAAVQSYHLKPDLVPQQAIAEGLLQELMPLVTGQRVLLARGNRGRDLLPTRLSAIAEVAQVICYEQADAIDGNSPAIVALRRGEIGFVTLSSSNTARAFLALFDDVLRGRVERGEIELVAISPETARVIQDLGYPVTAVAEPYTTEGMIQSIIRRVRARQGGAWPRSQVPAGVEPEIQNDQAGEQAE
jgi:uroporphyrinogen III methyltransferase/synthase